MKQPQ